MSMFEPLVMMLSYARHRTGMNPRAIPAKPTSVGYPAFAGFVGVAGRFTCARQGVVGRARPADTLCYMGSHA